MGGNEGGESSHGHPGPPVVAARSETSEEIEPDTQPAAAAYTRPEATGKSPGSLRMLGTFAMEDILSPVCPAPTDRQLGTIARGDGRLHEPSHRSDSHNGASEADALLSLGFFQRELAMFERREELTVRRGDTPTIPIGKE
jgi:hypothetical protein